MPSVVAGAIVSAIGLTGVVATVASAALATIGSLAIQSMVARGGKSSAASRTSAGRQIDLVRSSTEPRRVIYGQARVSGPLVFAHTTNSASGGKNHILHLVVALAGHPVQSIGAIFVDDVRLEGRKASRSWSLPPKESVYTLDPAYNGVSQTNLLQWRIHLGAPDQTYDTELYHAAPDAWTEQHRLRGVAYAIVRLQWESSVWAGGLPNLSWEVKGRLVYDPRTKKTAWSDNPALCIRDYLVSDFGLNCQADEIDEASFIAAANVCDELVPIASGGKQKRYTCNGVFALDEKPIDIVENLLTSCAGVLVYAQGKYRLYPAAYRVPVQRLDASLLRGAISVFPRTSLQEKVNTIRGTYTEPLDGWQQAEFPPVSVDLADDRNVKLVKDIDLPFTINTYEAQRLARVMLQKARYPLTVKMPCTLGALGVGVCEPVLLTIDQLGWTDKVFVPTGWSLSAEGGVDLVLQEDNASIYAWTGGVAPQRVAAGVSLPSIYPAPPLLGVDEEIVAGAVQLRVKVQSPEDAFIASVDVTYRRVYDSGANDGWRSAGSGQIVHIAPVEAGALYQVRARCVNVLGFTSAWVIVAHRVAGSLAPPLDVTTFTRYVVGAVLYLDWEAPSGLVSGYRLRYSPLTSGATWAGATTLAAHLQNTSVTLPARVGTYLLKAIDSFGRESEHEARVVNATAEERGALSVATLTEHPSFAGNKDNCLVNGDGQLVISSLAAFDAQSGSVDTISSTLDFDALASATDASQGIYDFANGIDLGAVYASVRLNARVKASVRDRVMLLSDPAGDFDGREGAFDGDAPSSVDVVLSVSTTEDNPANAGASWSAWQVLTLGDYRARGFRFRAVLVSENPMVTPAVEMVSVVLDMPERTESAQNVSCPSGGLTVTFGAAFKDVPSLSISGAALQSGETYTISNKSRSGFTIRFVNSSGVYVARAFDWMARGFGKAG